MDKCEVESIETVDFATLSAEEWDACRRLMIRQICTQMPDAMLQLQATNVAVQLAEHTERTPERRFQELFQEEAQREIRKRAMPPSASSDEGDTDDCDEDSAMTEA